MAKSANGISTNVCRPYFRQIAAAAADAANAADQQPLEDFLSASAAFHEKNQFPVDANRCHRVLSRGHVTEEEMNRATNSAYAVVHEETLPLLCAFLDAKREKGTAREKEFYKDMTLLSLIDRLIAKRPLKFVGPMDSYVLRDTRATGAEGWETIGTKAEREPLVMEDYMTYDEVKLAAFLCASSPVFPINSGKRHNGGIPDHEGAAKERRAIYVGLVGTRMAREGFMESREILVTPTQNVPAAGFGVDGAVRSPNSPVDPIFARFYGRVGGYFPTHVEMKRAAASASRAAPWRTFLGVLGLGGDPALAELAAKGEAASVKQFKGDGEELFFNVDVYKKRMRMTIETFLLEAEERGREEEKEVYVHAVGAGLGVWRVYSAQDAIFVSVFGEALRSLNLGRVTDVDFSWIPVKKCGETGDGETLPGTNVTLHFSMRDPFEKLTGPHEGKLIVASWAWDANSFPGNEYWSRSLTSSSDPAAACCSQIQETLNPFVNSRYAAKELRIASRAKGIVRVGQFVEEFLKEKEKP